MLRRKYLVPVCKCFSWSSEFEYNFFPKILRRISNLTLSSAQFNGVSRNQDDDDLVSRISSMLRDVHDPLDLQKGRQIHAQLVVNGLEDHRVSRNGVLGMYVLCGSVCDAKDVFFRLEKKASLHWNWMIRGFNMMGLFDFALLFYFKMFFDGALPDQHTYSCVLKSCCGLSAVGLGRLIHGMISSLGLEEDMYVGSSLIKLYAENGCIDEAREVFDKMPERDCVLWNVMIDGYVRNGDAEKAVQMFSRMRISGINPNYVSFICVLSVCALEGMLECGNQLHALAVKLGLELEASVANTLVSLYSRCQCLSDVQTLFSLMPQPDLVTWNGMISGYVQSGLKDEAFILFHQMQRAGVKPNSITLSSFLPSFSGIACLKQVKEVHSYITRNQIDMDAFLKSSLIDLYFKCKDVVSAMRIFHATKTMDIVICSAMISGYVLNGMSRDALEMFHRLLGAQLKPNAITLASVLPACSCLNALRLGKELHGHVIRNACEGRCYVSSALLDMYAKCGRLDLSYLVFRNISVKDSVAWNSMISSFTQNGQPEDAISHFRQMGDEGIRYDCVTVSSALSACAALPALHCGKEVHGFMMRSYLRSDLFAESALIDMYSKCGNLLWARRVFDSMSIKNEVSWNSIIASYGTHGLLTDALSLFQQMQEAGFRPDHVTFLTIISACGHAGQVEEGFRYYRCMSEQYGITARMEHYAAVVDLFGRAGLLNEAFSFIKSMPLKPDAGIWGALLGACRVYRNVELAELASQHLFELDPQNSGYYVLMSNINAVTGRWDGVSKVRNLMRERKVQKAPGCSWIEINNASHMFIAADESHPDSFRIYFLLKLLLMELRLAGYVPQPDLIYPQQECTARVNNGIQSPS
ncbi:TPR-like protein [Dioscorea alata]|uniref:TPR-like protein n=1 Tax=Dioscorea alata TaxID=55571 RepID=A0ACB7VHY4_DIOAL|nr:TPR-like protein [Dioscorea alata]